MYDVGQPLITTVIATIARQKLARAVESALAQPFAAGAHQIIVVNDSGGPLPNQPWQQAQQVTVVDTPRRERVVARNVGAGLAQGRYLHFLDDDDWLLPDGLLRLMQIADEHPAADWIYGGSRLVDRNGRYLITLDHRLSGNAFLQAMAGEWIPLQASLICADAFFKVGGFRPQTLVTQDVDLCRRLLLVGELVGCDTPVASIEMGEQGSSTDYSRLTVQSRRAREDILNLADVWPRMRESADSARWHGRIVRIYLGSTAWNLRRCRLWTAVSRALYMLATAAMARRYLLQPAFWRAIRTAYQSDSFARGFEQADRQRDGDGAGA